MRYIAAVCSRLQRYLQDHAAGQPVIYHCQSTSCYTGYVETTGVEPFETPDFCNREYHTAMYRIFLNNYTKLFAGLGAGNSTEHFAQEVDLLVFSRFVEAFFSRFRGSNFSFVPKYISPGVFGLCL